MVTMPWIGLVVTIVFGALTAGVIGGTINSSWEKADRRRRGIKLHEATLTLDPPFGYIIKRGMPSFAVVAGRQNLLNPTSDVPYDEADELLTSLGWVRVGKWSTQQDELHCDVIAMVVMDRQ